MENHEENRRGKGRKTNGIRPNKYAKTMLKWMKTRQGGAFIILATV